MKLLSGNKKQPEPKTKQSSLDHSFFCLFFFPPQTATKLKPVILKQSLNSISSFARYRCTDAQ